MNKHTTETTKLNVPPSEGQGRTRCEVWTRVMGYHRPVSQFNQGKQSEHAERQHFCENASISTQLAQNV